MKTTIFSEEGFTVYEENALTAEVESLLLNTVWGSKGIRYKHKNAKTKVENGTGQRIFSLYFQTTVAACIVFDYRKVYNLGKEKLGVYARYFSAASSFKGKGIIGSFCQKTFNYLKETTPEDALFYGLIENENQTSYSISQAMGFTKTSEIAVLPFSRFFPKKHDHVYGCCSCELDEYEDFLKDAYRNYNFLHFKNLFRGSDYMVYRVKGEILAGLQVHEASWELVNIPDPLEKFILKSFSKLPVFKKVYSDNTLRFLGLESIYIKEGHLDKFYKLLEQAMYEHNINAALFFCDKKSDYFNLLSENKKNGIVAGLNKTGDVSFMVHANNLNESIMKELKADPAFISVYDTI